MEPIHVVSTWRDQLATLRSRLSDHFAADYLMVEDLPRHEPAHFTVLDIDFRQTEELQTIKQWLGARPQDATVVVAIDDKSSRLQLAQACAIGATSVLLRPLTAEKIRRTLFRGADVMTLAPSELPEETHDLSSEFSVLQSVFAAAAEGRTPDPRATAMAGALIIEKIAEIGLADYLRIVRNHHSRTYQHCLSVTAIAVAFARQLGFNRADTEKVALAGLLHDIGKALIPLRILEKPDALSKDEAATMRSHAMLGHELLQTMPELPDDVLDMVLHHHEYLDGSGYPHGLKGDQISDLSRLITIADVYAALIEQRSYKPALSGGQAYRILQAMGPKLDAALVREFAPLSRKL
jgi:putative nucleotidyltransferase with HDIG domain